jgi:hypothetical protein
MGNARVLFWQIARADAEITLDDAEPRLPEDFTTFVQSCKKKDGSILKTLQRNGESVLLENCVLVIGTGIALCRLGGKGVSVW